MFEHMLSVYSPKSPADMDWATLYPTYAVEDRSQTKAKSQDGDEEEQSTKIKVLLIVHFCTGRTSRTVVCGQIIQGGCWHVFQGK